MSMEGVAQVRTEKTGAIIMDKDAFTLFLEVFYWAHVHGIAIVAEVQTVDFVMDWLWSIVQCLYR